MCSDTGVEEPVASAGVAGKEVLLSLSPSAGPDGQQSSGASAAVACRWGASVVVAQRWRLGRARVFLDACMLVPKS